MGQLCGAGLGRYSRRQIKRTGGGGRGDEVVKVCVEEVGAAWAPRGPLSAHVEPMPVGYVDVVLHPYHNNMVTLRTDVPAGTCRISEVVPEIAEQRVWCASGSK